MSKFKISIVGMWHQGVVAAACLSDINHKVTGIDSSKNIIDKLNNFKSPIYEPKLNNLIKKNVKKGYLRFSNNFSEVKNCDLIIIAHDTPVNDNDEVDLKTIIKDIKKLIPYISKQHIHVTAQLPAGTSNKIKNLIKKRIKNFSQIAYSPENLRLGQAIFRYKNPALPVIGTNDQNTYKFLSKVYFQFCREWEKTDLLTSEFLKHSLNTFLATSITLANEIGNITDSMGANGHDIGRLLKLEPRIGKYAQLRPGMGFSGGTLARDLKTLINFSKKKKLKSELLNSIWSSNKNHNFYPIKIINKIFKNSKKQIKIFVLGLTYKPDTSTLRRSISIEIINNLIKDGYIINSYDPKADKTELKNYPNIGFVENIYDGVKNADMIMLVTPWKNFLELDLVKIFKYLKNNYFFDIPSLFNKNQIEKKGFNYLSIGDGSIRKI